MGIGKNLKELLKEKNLSIKELSKLSGVSVNTLYSITKRDPKAINIETVEKIASALKMDVSYLYSYLVIDSDNLDRYYDPKTNTIDLGNYIDDAVSGLHDVNLNEEQKDLLKVWAILNDEERKSLFSYAKFLSDQKESLPDDQEGNDDTTE